MPLVAIPALGFDVPEQSNPDPVDRQINERTALWSTGEVWGFFDERVEKVDQAVVERRIDLQPGIGRRPLSQYGSNIAQSKRQRQRQA